MDAKSNKSYKTMRMFVRKEYKLVVRRDSCNQLFIIHPFTFQNRTTLDSIDTKWFVKWKLISFMQLGL